MRRLLSLALLGALAIGCGEHEDETMAPAAAADAPSSIPIAPVTGDAVYVVNGEDSTISVLDAVSGMPMGTIVLQGVSFPHHLYLSADRSKIVVAAPGHDLSAGHSMPSGEGGHHHGIFRHGDEMPMPPAASTTPASAPTGAILVLDALTGATIKSRRLDAPNHNALFSPNGLEIWTAQLVDEGTVLVLDAMTLETKQSIRVGRVPAEVTFSPDGRYAFVANGTSNDVTVIDAVTKAIVKTIPVDAEPVGAWPGADGLMYVDCEVAKTIKAIDPTTLEVIRTYPLGFTPGIAAVPPGRREELWVTDADGGKIVVDEKAGAAMIGDLTTAAGAHALAFTADGSTAFVTNQLAASVSVVDASTRTVRATVPVGKKPNGIVFRAK